MLSLKNNIYIAPTEDTTTQDYCYYMIYLSDNLKNAPALSEYFTPIFFGKLFKNPKSRTVNGVKHNFYTKINDIIKPYFNSKVINQATNDYIYSNTIDNSNILNFKVEFSLFSSMLNPISTTFIVNVVDVHSFFGTSSHNMGDNIITTYCDVDSIDNSLVFYKNSNTYNHYIDFNYAKYFNINFGYIIPKKFTKNVYLYESTDTPITDWNVRIEFSFRGDQIQIDLSDTIDYMRNGSPKFCLNVGALYGKIKYEVENRVGGPIDGLDSTYYVSDIKLILVGKINDAYTELSTIYLPFRSAKGCAPVNVKQGNTIYKALYIDSDSCINSVTFEGVFKESSNYKKSTYFDENFEERVNNIVSTDSLILNTGWVSEKRAKEISKLNESKYIVLSKTTFGNNTYTTSFYDVVSTTNSYTEYKYLADKKLKNIEITLTLNKERII